jgi:A/G-specific adenine glycosylase
MIARGGGRLPPVSLAADLLEWYDHNRRDLPWRGKRTPYEIWVSEIMLQQTRVETAESYYPNFLKQFPTLERLAEAPVEKVLAAWSGLGYYRRARQLHSAACQLATAGRGVPSTLEELRELPGIGEYTAAAVASIAFGVPVAVLDGNVERVLSRQIALSENPRAAGPRRRLKEAASSLLDPERPGDFNQAMMELGATVCIPRRPRCSECPIGGRCRALELGSPEAYPALPARRKQQFERRCVVVVEEGDRLLVVRRPDEAELLAGIWELPWAPVAEADEASVTEETLARRYGGTWIVERSTGRVRHAMTYRAIEATACLGKWSSDEVAEVTEGGELRWVSRAGLDDLPTTSLVEKVLSVLQPEG